jgi:hypothetical protein
MRKREARRKVEEFLSRTVEVRSVSPYASTGDEEAIEEVR